MPDNFSDPQQIELQKRILEEAERLRKSLESRTAETPTRNGQPQPIPSKAVENKDKVGTGSRGLPMPMPVVIVDENASDKNVYLDLIKGLYDSQKETVSTIQDLGLKNKVSSSATVDLVKISLEETKANKDYRHEVRRIDRERYALSKEEDRLKRDVDQKWQDHLKSIDDKTESKRKRGLFERIIERKLRGDDLLTATIGGVKDKIVDSVKTFVDQNKVLELALTGPGSPFGKVARSIQRDIDTERREKEDRFSSKDELFKKMQADLQERRMQLDEDQEEAIFDLTEAMNRLKDTKGDSKDSKRTYTQDEEEKFARGGNKLLISIWRENALTNKILQNLSDPRTNAAMSVRIVEVKPGTKFGMSDKLKEDKKKGGWLDSILSMFGSGIKSITGLLSNLTPALALLAKGLAVAGAAYVGWQAGSYIADKVIEYRREMRKEERERFNEKFRAENKETLEGLKTAGVSEEKFLEIVGMARGEETEKLSKTLSELTQEQQQAVTNRLRREMENKEVIASRERRKQAESWNLFASGESADAADEARDDARNVAWTVEEAIEGATPSPELQKNNMKDALIESAIEVEKIKRSSTGGLMEDPVAVEVSGLRKDLKKLLGEHTKNLENNQDRQNAVAIGVDAITSPLSFPDNFLNRAPSAPAQTGVIKT